MVAAWLLTLALLLKVIVPSGYMLDTSGGSLGLVVCSGMTPTPAAAKPAGAMHGMAHHSGHESKKDGQTAEQPCAFAGLNAASMAAADPMLLALAIAFIVAIVFRHVARKHVRARAHLRPPLRGPPILL